MNFKTLRTPRLSEPLSAALIGAGSFLFLAALSGLGPFGSVDQAAWRLAQPGQAQALAGTAVLVQGAAAPSLGRHERLASQVAWLRQQGAGAIILEGWFDEQPQAEAKALAEEIRQRLAQLPRASRVPALKALSESASSLDLDQRLAQALGQAQPLVLAYATRHGAETPLPDALQRQGYEVTLRGRRQALTPRRAERLPYPGLLAAVARSGAVSLDEPDALAVPAAVELQSRWYDSLGLEGARLALGVPLEGLRYRWRQGRLSTLELKGVRYPLDEEGRVRVPEALPSLPALNWEDLQQDQALAQKLKGKVVFFRPWPQALSDVGAFEAQERLFAAVVERDVLVPELGWGSWAFWLLAWGAAIVGLAWAPAWLGAALWAIPLAWLIRGFSQDFQALAQPLALAASALALGLGWRLQLSRRARVAADRRFHGRVAAQRLSAWQARLPIQGGSLRGSYGVLGPASLASERAFESWLREHDAFIDSDLPSGSLGIFVPAKDEDDHVLAARAFQSLLKALPTAAVAAVPGPIAFSQTERLGALAWRLTGQARQEALELSLMAKKGQFLLLERDYAPWHGKLRIQVTGSALEAKEGALKVLNVLL
jgi:hypothetical protein